MKVSISLKHSDGSKFDPNRFEKDVNEALSAEIRDRIRAFFSRFAFWRKR